MEAAKKYLEDMRIGDTFESREYRVDLDEIRTFAQSFDPQVFHLDEAAAAQTVFRGLAASGWHTAAITMRLLVESVPIAGGMIGVGGEISWPRPTRPGDSLHVVTRVIEIIPSQSKPDRGIVVLQGDTINQNGEICQQVTPRMLVFRRQPAEPDSNRAGAETLVGKQ
ncbi:MaoC family dehydratase [Paraburkholderia sp. C35]|uniref:MaoC family dehydratase n=1 Tax=Paraburkholderia sp. C35 TaxID=2126993 RepID=UPI000D69CD77|nr:MaoC family dehydratase [Paraburkholderia sp. C35]